MNILIVTTVYENSIVGAGTFIHALSKTMKNVHILSENVKDGPNSTRVVLNLSPIQKKMSAWSRIKPYQRALAKIYKDFDIIFFNSPIFAYRLPFAVKKKVIFVHDYENTKLKTNSIKSTIQSLVSRHIESSALKDCKTVITNSIFTKNILVKSYRLPKSTVNVCHLGIDLKRFSFEPRTELNNPIKILFVKEDYRRGGLFVLLEALNNLPEFNFELTLVGFESSATPLNTNSHIEANLKGHLTNKEISLLLKENDIYCVPSLREALGLGNMEAMATGTAVVTTDSGGISEVIDVTCGWIAKGNDSNALRQAIRSCIINGEQRNKKIFVAYDKVKQFDLLKVARQLESILKSI